MKKKPLSAEAQKIWDSLSEEEKDMIQKKYPILRDRDAMIRQLNRFRRIPQRFLCELSGLSAAQVQRICEGKQTEKNKIYELTRLLKPHKDLIKALNDLLN